MEVGSAIMEDLKKILKLVFVEAVKKREQALDDSVSALDSLLTKLEAALNHGLKFRKRRLVVSWRSTKGSPSFFSLLEELEQRLPFDPLLEGGDFWGTLGLQPVRELKWVTDPPSRLKIWLRQSLNVGLLEKRLRLVLKYPEILQKWYEPYGLLKNVDTVDEFISIVVALNAVGINLSLDPNVVLQVGKEVDTVLDVLSPIDSPCSSPEYSPHEGIKSFDSWRDSFFQGFGDKEDSDRCDEEIYLLESPFLSDENTNPVQESHRRVGLPAKRSSMFEFDTKSGITSSEDRTSTQEVIRTDNNHLPSTHGFPDDKFGLGDWSEFTHDFGPPTQKDFVNLHEESNIPRGVSKVGIYGSDSLKDIGENFGSAGLMRPIQATGRPDLDDHDDDEDDDDENWINEDNKRTLFDEYSTLCENGVGSGEVGMTEMLIQCVDDKNDASGSMRKHLFEIDSSCDQPSTYPEVLDHFEKQESGKQETTSVKSKTPSRSMAMSSCTCCSDLVIDDDEVLGHLDTIEGRCKSCNCHVTGFSRQTLPQAPFEVLTATGNCSSSCNLKEVEFVPISTEIDPLLAQPWISGFVALEVSAKSNNNSEQKGALSSLSSSDMNERDALLLGPDEVSRYVETAEVKETYVETILDMENVLLERDRLDVRCDPHFSQNPQEVLISQADRDKTSTASTSMEITTLQSREPSSSPCNHQQVEILKVDVIGSNQQKGGASISDWLVVGMQDFTLYHIRVHGSDAQIWEVDRRYKEFVTLQQQLSRLFSGRNDVSLPAPWEKVATETWKLIGNTSLHVIELRRALIQVCFQSLLEAGPPLSTAPPVLRFLLPSGRHAGAKSLNISTTAATTTTTFIDSQLPGSLLPLEYIGSNPTLERQSSSDILEPLVQPLFGKSIKLLTQVHKKKSMSQQLRIQHNACAGCHKELDVVTGVVSGLAQHFRLRGPQWCEYSGQLFCCVCHLNELAVLPALVLQHWDFAPQRVSQLAKAFLDSIYNQVLGQPMLCVSAVNPYLYSKVPILAHLRESRKRLSKIFSCIQCPSRTRIQSMAASRLYLLEDNDFFALRDLVDLSKGAFAVLPGFVQTLFERSSLHIKRECSICLGLGEPCGANDFCNDPNDIIYPFQEDNVKRCSLCKLPFHKRCFIKIKSCPVCTRAYIQHKSEKAKAISVGGLESIPECSNNATQ